MPPCISTPTPKGNVWRLQQWVRSASAMWRHVLSIYTSSMVNPLLPQPRLTVSLAKHSNTFAYPSENDGRLIVSWIPSFSCKLYNAFPQSLLSDRYCNQLSYRRCTSTEVINTALAPPYSGSNKLQLQKNVQSSSLIIDSQWSSPSHLFESTNWYSFERHFYES